MASIRKRRNGKFEARYRTPSGDQRGKVFGTKREAQRYLERVGADMQRGAFVDPQDGKTSFKAVADNWLRTAELKPRSRYSYERILAAHLLPRFGDRHVAKITEAMVREYVAELKAEARSASQVLNIWSVLKVVLALAVDDGLIVKNPAALESRQGRRVLPQRPNNHDSQVVLTASQVKALVVLR